MGDQSHESVQGMYLLQNSTTLSDRCHVSISCIVSIWKISKFDYFAHFYLIGVLYSIVLQFIIIILIASLGILLK